MKENKKLVVLGVTGSIACVRAFDLVRELRRKGFEVQVVLSDSAREMASEQALEFASGRKVISKISGAVEHVKFFGKKGKAVLLLIAPATANTISKIAMGIDDTPVTTFATIAIGAGKPVLLAPAMHEPMYEHPIVRENLAKLEKRGVRVIAPLMEEGKAKLQNIEEIVFEAEKALSTGRLAGKKVLVASGAFQEKIDEIRVITNNSSGRMGLEIALECMREEAEVKFIGNVAGGTFLEFDEVKNAEELEGKVLKELARGYDFFYCPAALPDFEVKKFAGKIGSAKKFALELSPKKKLLEKIAGKFPKTKIIAFKAEHGKSNKELENIALKFLRARKVFAVVATDLKKFPLDAKRREMVFVSAGKKKWLKGTKEKIAKEIVALLNAGTP